MNEFKWITGGVGVAAVLAFVSVIWSRLDTRAMARRDAQVQADTDAVIAGYAERSKLV